MASCDGTKRHHVLLTSSYCVSKQKLSKFVFSCH